MEVCTEWTRFVRLGLRKSVFDNNHCSDFLFMPLKCEKRMMENSLLLNLFNTHHTQYIAKFYHRTWIKHFTFATVLEKSRKHLLVESKWQRLNNAIIPLPSSEVRCGRRGWIDVIACGYLVPMQCSLEWEWIRAVARQTCSQAMVVWWRCLAG